MAATMRTMAAATAGLLPLSQATFGRVQGVRRIATLAPGSRIVSMVASKGASGRAIDTAGENVVDRGEGAQEVRAGDDQSEGFAGAWGAVESAVGEDAENASSEKYLSEFVMSGGAKALGALGLVSLLGFAAQGVLTGDGADPFASNLFAFAALEPALTRGSFATLFLATLIHWGKPLYMNNTALRSVGKLAMGTAYGCLTGILLSRWGSSGHLPLSNLYESSMFLSWCFCTIHLIFENQTKNDWIGIITAPSALLTNAFATLGIPKEMQQSSALVPALQSNWLMMHVSMMIFSYSTLMIGSLLAIAFLFVDTKDDTALATQRGKLGQQLDHYSYRSITLGFPLLTIGILSGAVWANEAWGSYWSWDPKETWALITWLVFAIYVHTRMNKGWQGKKPAMVASGGFFVIWICYLGVNVLGKGLHSYGWIS